MIRPLLSLERLSFDEQTGMVGYRYLKESREVERMDYLEFIAQVVSHIPDKGQVTVRYYGLAPMPVGGKSRRQTWGLLLFGWWSSRFGPSLQGLAEMIRKVYEVNPLVCPNGD